MPKTHSFAAEPSTLGKVQKLMDKKVKTRHMPLFPKAYEPHEQCWKAWDKKPSRVTVQCCLRAVAKLLKFGHGPISEFTGSRYIP